MERCYRIYYRKVIIVVVIKPYKMLYICYYMKYIYIMYKGKKIFSIFNKYGESTLKM